MSMNTTRITSIRPAALILAATLACTGAIAGGAAHSAAKSAAQAEGLKYRQACMAGQTHQDRATCLKEANNFLADLKKNPGKFESAANIEANAKARCEPLSGSDRAACMARASGQGTITGSVEGGGIYRELVTIETLAPVIQGADTAPPAAAVAPATQ
jgi:hypothetical protein